MPRSSPGSARLPLRCARTVGSSWRCGTRAVGSAWAGAAGGGANSAAGRWTTRCPRSWTVAVRCTCSRWLAAGCCTGRSADRGGSTSGRTPDSGRVVAFPSPGGDMLLRRSASPRPGASSCSRRTPDGHRWRRSRPPRSRIRRSPWTRSTVRTSWWWPRVPLMAAFRCSPDVAVAGCPVGSSGNPRSSPVAGSWSRSATTGGYESARAPGPGRGRIRCSRVSSSWQRPPAGSCPARWRSRRPSAASAASSGRSRPRTAARR